MTKSAALIRTVAIDKNVERLEAELKPFFGNNIYYMIDRYSEDDVPALRREGRELLVGRGFLQMYGLPWFPRVGWQCGDFMYYAAAEALPEYDFYWLIESDVSVHTDTKVFFEQFEASAVDFILANFGSRSENWYWYKSASELNNGQVYGGLFPISRMSRSAAIHLRNERTKYSTLRYVQEQTWATGVLHLYANDEAFAASVLMRDGFSCQSLDSLILKSMMSDFSLTFPIHPGELPFMQDGIIHPVCEGDIFKIKLYALLITNGSAAARTRLKEASSRLGIERVEDLIGISETEFTHEIELVSILNERLDAIRPKIRDVGDPARFVSTWIFQNKVAVFDFLIWSQRIAFDLTLNVSENQYRLETLPRDPEGRELLTGLSYEQFKPDRYLVGEWASDLDSEIRDQDIADHILDVIRQVSCIETNILSQSVGTIPQN